MHVFSLVVALMSLVCTGAYAGQKFNQLSKEQQQFLEEIRFKLPACDCQQGASVGTVVNPAVENNVNLSDAVPRNSQFDFLKCIPHHRFSKVPNASELVPYYKYIKPENSAIAPILPCVSEVANFDGVLTSYPIGKLDQRHAANLADQRRAVTSGLAPPSSR